jgi:hypothetical protein
MAGLRPARRAAVGAAAMGLDAGAAGRLTAESMYDVTHPALAARHCAYSVGVAFVEGPARNRSPCCPTHLEGHVIQRL